MKLNDRIALAVTRGVGTMACAYLFCALAFISLPAAIRTGDAIVIVAWVAQTFFQLVLLPVIIVGQRIAADQAEARHAEASAHREAVVARLDEHSQHLKDHGKRLKLIHAKVED